MSDDFHNEIIATQHGEKLFRARLQGFAVGFSVAMLLAFVVFYR